MRSDRLHQRKSPQLCPLHKKDSRRTIPYRDHRDALEHTPNRSNSGHLIVFLRTVHLRLVTCPTCNGWSFHHQPQTDRNSSDVAGRSGAASPWNDVETMRNQLQALVEGSVPMSPVLFSEIHKNTWAAGLHVSEVV